MRYKDFEDRITQMGTAAHPNARYRFAVETIGRLAGAAQNAVEIELSAFERALLEGVAAGVTSRPPDELATELNSLNDSMCDDDVRAIEFRPVLTEFLCALDSFIRYRQTGDPAYVAAIAVNSVNSIDYQIEDVNYSVENVLGSPLMVAEFDRQRRLLTA